MALCLCLILGLALSVHAESAASSIQLYVSINSDGDADVTMTVRLRLETAVDSLSFPLPVSATNIQMNDRGVNSVKNTTAILVDLGSDIKNYTGEYAVTFKYQLPDVVSVVEDKMTLNLPMLSGFDYPVEAVSFTIILPTTIEGRPAFKSTYHQDSIDSFISYSVSNNMVTGMITQPLKDRETLSMSMTVTEEMFAGVSTYVRVGNPEVTPMIVCAVLAVLYWLIFLRGFPLVRVRRATPPEGVTAGELSTRLTLGGADLTSMVFTWAQLGYVMIHLDDNGRVVLHKRMEMGNERSNFEVKTFHALFGKRRYIDGTGYQYAQLARKIALTSPGKKSLCNPKGGNVKLFRWLFCGVQGICGICYAMNFTGLTALQVILAIVFGFLGAVSAWLIQEGMYRLHLRYKMPLILSLVLAVVWVIVGLWSGPWVIGLCSVLGQLFAGLASAYGGRRTDLGRQNACGILGLRQHFRNVTKEDLKRIQLNDPEYFFNMMPYAMALGVDKAFARRFGKKKLPQCPYFVCGVRGRMTAEDWARFMHEAAEILDYRQRRMAWEKYAIIHIGR